MTDVFILSLGVLTDNSAAQGVKSSQEGAGGSEKTSTSKATNDAAKDNALLVSGMLS
jgi:hypothetical protein